MKMNAQILTAALALLTVSAAHAQESSRLSAEYLRHATPLIHWPRGLEPQNVDVFVHNEGWIGAPPDVVWTNLIDATQWPSWYANSADVRSTAASPGLRKAWLLTGRHSTFRSGARSTSLSQTVRSDGASIIPPSRFTTPGCWSPNAEGRA
jgi:hypothetical protein